MSASPAQRLSQEVLQQKPSMAQTASQQAASLQNGVPLLEQQSPANWLPQAGHASQMSWASPAQMLSQEELQQKPSMAHTASQQAASLQKGVPLLEQQSPAKSLPQAGQTSQMSWASLAQMLSQVLLQQNASMAQTALQQAASLQKGEPLLEQQSPAEGAPQPDGHGSQAPRRRPRSEPLTMPSTLRSPQPAPSQLPRSRPRSAPPTLPFPFRSPRQGPGQAGRQMSCASPAQMPSQVVSQQKLSMAQIARQHDASLQPGEPFETKQSPSPGQPPAHALPALSASTPRPVKIQTRMMVSPKSLGRGAHRRRPAEK